jgi:hypothetical protein
MRRYASPCTPGLVVLAAGALYAVRAVSPMRLELPVRAEAVYLPGAFPEPPQQQSPWSPPVPSCPASSSPRRPLFSQRVADPRGCEYRGLEIMVGASTGVPASASRPTTGC